ncbi:hypothetical protein [Natrinema salsiterrestre]|uniref:Ig-like domain-containing protein n=1 Tax=Natrinema salsiterrestre TaxID=2950540 RepID=A0A9Q4Q1U5_9EURY|nr:hypothetical protein [Natrinema salsiterrestre]MDF9744077.1 hypothetical protein [Natrinema salsiterrestre]
MVAVTSAAALSGCGYVVGGDDDLVVTNDRQGKISIELELVDGSDEALFADTVSLSADSEVTEDGVLPSSGTVTLTVTVDGDLSNTESFEVGEETSLHIDIEDAITFEKTV